MATKLFAKLRSSAVIIRTNLVYNLVCPHTTRARANELKIQSNIKSLAASRPPKSTEFSTELSTEFSPEFSTEFCTEFGAEF